MPPLIDIVDDEDYASSEDSDFAPETAAEIETAAASEGSEPESDGEEQQQAKPKKSVKRKRAAQNEEAEDVGFENSGDEEIVGKGLKKQRRRRRRGEEDDDEGGEGGFVKTRRMAALAIEEKAPLASTATATVDVDALWASMMSGTSELKAPDEGKGPETSEDTTMQEALNFDPPNQGSVPSRPADEDDKILIHRTYNFAGKVHTESKLVARGSAEARLYLEQNPNGASVPIPATTKPLRPTKLARRSIFESITSPPPPRPDLKFGVQSIKIRHDIKLTVEQKAKKLNTVDKSKMDWAGFVDKEGIRDELVNAEKAKGAYLGQREFLDRVDGKREEESRRARLAGSALKG